MTTHSSILAWRIQWTEEPGGLQSIGVAKSQTQLKRLSMDTEKAIHGDRWSPEAGGGRGGGMGS